MSYHLKMKTTKRIFDVPVKSKEEAYGKIIEIRKNNDYATGNLLGYEHF